MRYLLAIVLGLVTALGAAVLVSSPLASWVVARHTFDSPDTVNDLHSFVYLATNFVALVAGWLVGWTLGKRFEKPVDLT